MSTAQIAVFQYPDEWARSAHYRLWINELEIPVGQIDLASYACVGAEGSLEIRVETSVPVAGAVLRPVSREIPLSRDNRELAFRLAQPENLCVDVPGLPPLYLFFSPYQGEAPEPRDPNVFYFEAGKVHEIGELHLKENQTVYAEGGAVVRGQLRAHRARNVVVRGAGVFDGGWVPDMVNRPKMFVFEECENVLVQDITMINPASWMLALGACQEVTVRNLHQLGEVVSSDGIDIVGCRNVLVEKCFLRNNDDCIAIKAKPIEAQAAAADYTVEEVLVRDCTFANDRAGNVLEIGHELPTDRVSGIRFENLDILHCHGNGAVFSIHNCDYAIVSDVVFENIRVEHYWDKLVDLRVTKSMWSSCDNRGQIRDVVFRDIRVNHTTVNTGYSLSIIGGYDAQHTVESVIFEGFYLADSKVRSLDELDAFTRHASGIEFR